MSPTSENEEIPFYTLPCECGNLLQITAAQAGEMLHCAACHRSIFIPSLTSLKKRAPDGYFPDNKRPTYQYHLKELLAVVTITALFLSAYNTINYYFDNHWLGAIFHLIFWIVFGAVYLAFAERLHELSQSIIQKLKHNRNH